MLPTITNGLGKEKEVREEEEGVSRAGCVVEQM